jgi:hypothetical protein
MLLRTDREKRDGENLPAFLQNLEGEDQVVGDLSAFLQNLEGEDQIVGDSSIIRGRKISMVVVVRSRGKVVRIGPSVVTRKVIMKVLLKSVPVPLYERQGYIKGAPLPVGDGDRQAIPTSSH